MQYIGSNGVVFTDADIEKWADDADNAFQDYEFTTVEGRPWESKTEPMITKTIRFPASVWKRLEQQAARLGMSASAYAREKLRA